jgi:hypothetical protein
VEQHTLNGGFRNAIVLLSALVAFVMQRRQDRVASIASHLLAGLIIPPYVVPRSSCSNG